MLQQLYIKNVVLIDEILIEFNKGLNILSGETGAGKSIVIGSLAFVLGARATKDFIKKGKEQASVEALISISNDTTKTEIKELGVDIDDEDSSILISRSFNTNGRNNCKINGRPATVSMIKEICEKFIDIHGQHEHQSLLNSAKHIVLLDRFCENDIEKPKEELLQFLKNYKNTLKQISELSMGKDRQELIDFFSYQINEIEDAKLSKNEENELLERRKILSKAENLKRLYMQSAEVLSEDETSILDNFNIILNNMMQIADIDNTKLSIYDELQDIYARLDDFARGISKNKEVIEYNEDELNEVENRLESIQKLKRKYGASIIEILQFKEETSLKLDNLVNNEDKILSLHKEKETLEVEIKNICNRISQIRKNQALILEQNVEKHLKDLGMENSKFKIDISKKDIFSKNGFDKVEFLICTNLGEDLKPLSKIASGGEMSRVMLSLKAVLSFVDTIDTFIFDEIDTGISGRTAQMVAEKMSFLAQNNQIICITHLPQIAAMGDEQFLIDKNTKDENTITTIIKLDEEKAINELARMIGGATITNATLLAAKEMKQQANKIKKCRFLERYML